MTYTRPIDFDSVPSLYTVLFAFHQHRPRSRLSPLLGRIAALTIYAGVCCYRQSSVVCLSVIADSPAKNRWTDPDVGPGVKWGGPEEPCVRWGSTSRHVNGQLFLRAKRGGKDMYGSKYTQSNSAGGADERVWCGCWLGCTRRGAYWRHLANTTKPSMWAGDAALCQTTLTICY